MKKIVVIFGTRPEAIKLCPVVLALKNNPAFDCKVLSGLENSSSLELEFESGIGGL